MEVEDGGLDTSTLVHEARPSEEGEAAKRSKVGLLDTLQGLVSQREGRAHLSGEITVLSQSAIQVGRTVVAVGLKWEPPNDDFSLAEQAAEASAGGEEYDLYGYYDDRRAMVGFAATGHGLSRGSVVGLSLFPASIGENWLAAFQLGARGYWIVAFNQRDISTDAVYMEMTEARNEFNSLVGGAHWERVIAPADWFVPDAEDGDLAEWATGPARRLRPLYPLRAFRPHLMGGVAAIALVMVGWYAWDWYQARQVRLEQERIAQLKAERARLSIRYPWQEAASPPRVVDECVAAFNVGFFSVAGWNPEPLECKNNKGEIQVALEWGRAPQGRFYWLEAAKPADIEGAVNLSKSGTAAALSFTVKVPPEAARKQEKPWDEADIESRVRERFNAFGIDVALSAKTRSLSRSERAQLTSPVYNYYSLRLMGSSDLHDVMKLLADIPAAVAESVVLDTRDGSWELRARIYMPPILPPPPDQASQSRGWSWLNF
ncbi:type 4b pilus protein PilO2 [Amorphus sp. 3PC139-8]|uniref:type 4b pilus protein PilO2 n=1 Tax=Amorphus sp. 3PC139-8 TaxID=2735676 RepID=UPI00345CC26F